MRNLAPGLAIGAIIAVILAGGAVGALELWGPGAKPPPPPESRPPPFVRLGPDGTDRTVFGENVERVSIPGSGRYDLCVGDMRVQRPSMMTTDMPDAFCSVTRQGRKGPWQMSTGGWQTCQAVCVRLEGKR